MEDFQFSCTTNTLTNYARMSPHHVWKRDESLRRFVWEVSEKIRENKHRIFHFWVTDGTV